MTIAELIEQLQLACIRLDARSEVLVEVPFSSNRSVIGVTFEIQPDGKSGQVIIRV